jgi:hypothetical protein
VLSDQAGALAVDGDPGTSWNSGGGPLQWIQIDLGQDYAIAEIRLTVAQSPEGHTIHVIYGTGSSTAGIRHELHVFSGTTADSDVLVFTPETPIAGIRTIRIETTTTPSWVAWREVEVIAAE